MKFLLTTDTSCDERKTVLDELGIPWIPLTYILDGKVYPDNYSTDAEYQAFYEKMDAGALPVTSQITPEQHQEFFENLIRTRHPQAIVHLSLSSGISSTAASAQKAVERVHEQYPDAEIYCIDTLGATHVHNMLLREAIKMRDSDMSAKEAAAQLEVLKKHIQGWFVVRNLQHLKRGGRISAVAAAFGSMLNIKPILIIQADGSLKVVNKVIGMKKALDFFVDIIAKQSDPLPDEVTVVHANDLENAQLLQQKITARYPGMKVNIGWLGPIIGAHCGAGMLAVIFIGKQR